MIKFRFLLQIFCLSFLILTVSCKDNPSASERNDSVKMRGDFIPEPDLAELIIDLNTSMEDAFRNGDMKEVAAYFANDAIILGPDAYKLEGSAAINDYWTRIQNPVDWDLAVTAFSRSQTAILENEAFAKMQNKPPAWQAIMREKLKGKDHIYQLGYSTLKNKNATGDIKISKVNYILIWVQQPDGVYKIGLHSYNRK